MFDLFIHRKIKAVFQRRKVLHLKIMRFNKNSPTFVGVLDDLDAELNDVPREYLLGLALLARHGQSVVVHKRAVAALRILQKELSFLMPHYRVVAGQHLQQSKSISNACMSKC